MLYFTLSKKLQLNNKTMSEGSANSAGAGAAAGGDGGNTTQQAAATTSTEGTKSVENSSPNGEKKPTETEKIDHRKVFRERINKHYPDSDPEDSDSFYKNANERYSKHSDYRKKNEAVNANMIKTFNSNPELSGFMRDVMKGAPIHEAIARNIDPDSIKRQEGDPDFDGWNKADLERKQKFAENEAYIKSLDENVGLTIKEIQSFQTETGLSDEDTQSFMKQVDELVSDAINGKVSKATLKRLHKAITADSDVEAAEVKGRNANIEAKKVVSKEGDGLPSVRSTTEDQGDKKEVKVDKWVDAVDRQIERRSR